jgi:ribosomal protein L29
MARLKSKDIKTLNKTDLDKKLKELNLELVKSRASTSKGGTARIREIKKTIARIFTITKSNTGKPVGESK